MLLTQASRDYYNTYKDHYTHIVSLVCPDEKTLITPLHNNHIIVKMWDIDKQIKNKFREYEPPEYKTIVNILNWAVDKWYMAHERRDDFRILVHCDAGVSRSAAVALGILWRFSSMLFTPHVHEWVLHDYLDARMTWCASVVHDDSTMLKRYIEGRLNPGVLPNKAILHILRVELPYFPW